MNGTMRCAWVAAGCVALAVIGSGCGGADKVAGPGSTPVASKIEWTQNGVRKSYSQFVSGLDLPTSRWSLGVDEDGIEVMSFETPYALGKWMVTDSAEMAMGRPGCDEYAAGPIDGGSGWIEITKIETVGRAPAVVEGRFEVTLTAQGYCSSSWPVRVCSGTFVSSAYD